MPLDHHLPATGVAICLLLLVLALGLMGGCVLGVLTLAGERQQPDYRDYNKPAAIWLQYLGHFVVALVFLIAVVVLCYSYDLVRPFFA